GQQPALERRQVAGADQIAFVFALAILHGDSTLAPPGVWLSRQAGSDHFFGALRADDDFAGFGHATRDAEDFLLRRLDIADAHRAEAFQVVAQQLAGALGHVLEDLFLDVLV